MVFEQLPLERQVHVQVERLILEDAGRYAPYEIERLTREIVSRYASAPIQQYVPNLVYHDLKSQLIKVADSE